MASYFFLFLLAACLSLQPHLIAAHTAASAPASSPSSSAGLVEKACENSHHKNFCISLLKSHRNCNDTNLKGLAFIALRIAEKNATETSLFIQKTLRAASNLKPAVQEALSDCSDHYITLVELIDDAINALVSHATSDVVKFVKAVVADLDGCDASIKGQDSTVAHNNLALRQILDISLTVANAYAKSSP